MFKNSQVLLFAIFILIIFSLLAALIPTSDIDHDGFLDSLVTEGFLLIPMLCSVTGLFFLLTRLPAACLAVPRSISTLLVPPPISNR
jgi:hypothetical protein